MKLKKILILAVLSCSTTKANCHTASCAIEGTPNQGLDFWLETFDQIAQEILKLVEEKGIKLSDLSQNDLKEVKNLGKKSFEEILEKITEFGYAVGQELPADLITAIKKKIEGQ